MVRKILQWVPIEGTRWRSEVTNGHENYHAVDSHYGVAPRVDMAPLREFPNTRAPFSLCRRGPGGAVFILYPTQSRASVRRR